MTTRPLSAGDIIDAYCTNCRTVMNHTIVALVATHPARVQCNTCHGVHNYRKVKSAADETKASSVRSRPPAARKGQDDARLEWVALLSTRKNERAPIYDMKASRKVGDLVNHSSFGLGVVRQLVGPNKMEVLFEEGVKLLRCG